jgi:hypothetical protein
LDGAVPRMTSFVNPYTFVPHVPVPHRDEPAGHAVLGPGRLSGGAEGEGDGPDAVRPAPRSAADA